MKKLIIPFLILLIAATCSYATDITYTDKNTGDQFTAADANEIKTAVNSKSDDGHTHASADVSFTPYGDLGGSDVDTVIKELEDEKYSAGDTLQTNVGTTLPASCTQGQIFLDTDADTNGQLYACVATDTWKDVDDDGGAGGMSEIVEDITPQLGGPLDINGQEIQAGTEDIVLQMGDNAGTYEIEFEDSDGTRVGGINSDGDLDIEGDFTVNGSISVAASATPTAEFKDSDLLGADQYAASIVVNCTTLTDGSEDCDYSVYAQLGGTDTLIFAYDASDDQVEFSKPTTLQNGDIVEAELATDAVTYAKTVGSYKAQAPLLGDPDSWTPATDDYYGGVWIATADGEDTLSAVAAGMNLTLKADDGVTAIFNPDTSDTIIRNGVSLAQGEALVTSAAYGICVMQYRAANTWDADCSSGMTEETP